MKKSRKMVRKGMRKNRLHLAQLVFANDALKFEKKSSFHKRRLKNMKASPKKAIMAR